MLRAAWKALLGLYCGEQPFLVSGRDLQLFAGEPCWIKAVELFRTCSAYPHTTFRYLTQMKANLGFAIDLRSTVLLACYAT